MFPCKITDPNIFKVRIIQHSFSQKQIGFILRYHPLSTYAKFSEKPTFLTHWHTHIRVCIKVVRNFSFSEHFAYVLIEWFLKRTQTSKNEPSKQIQRLMKEFRVNYITFYRYQPIANMLVVSNHLEYGGRTLTKKRDLF